MGTVIYTTALPVGGCFLLPVGLLLVGHSSHWCGCSDIYNCASFWRALLATSQAAPCRVLWSLVGLLQKLGCAHATVSLQQLMTQVAATLSLLYGSPSQECHHGCPITKEVTKVTEHQLTNETQGMRVIRDLFLEHPEFGHLLAGCQCPQSDFRTGHFPPQLKLSSHIS